MRIDVEVRSAGWGPRGVETRSDNSSTFPNRTRLAVCAAIQWQGVYWPRDGVAVIIRRAA